jgi:hypothetical protein
VSSRNSLFAINFGSIATPSPSSMAAFFSDSGLSPLHVHELRMPHVVSPDMPKQFACAIQPAEVHATAVTRCEPVVHRLSSSSFTFDPNTIHVLVTAGLASFGHRGLRCGSVCFLFFFFSVKQPENRAHISHSRHRIGLFGCRTSKTA